MAEASGHRSDGAVLREGTAEVLKQFGNVKSRTVFSVLPEFSVFEQIYLVFEGVTSKEGLATLAGYGVEVVAQGTITTDTANFVGFSSRVFIFHCFRHSVVVGFIELVGETTFFAIDKLS